jgi:hypothetical protein
MFQKILNFYFKFKFYNSYAEKKLHHTLLLAYIFRKFSFNFILELKFNIYMHKKIINKNNIYM